MARRHWLKPMFAYANWGRNRRVIQQYPPVVQVDLSCEYLEIDLTWSRRVNLIVASREWKVTCKDKTVTVSGDVEAFFRDTVFMTLKNFKFSS